MFEKIWIRLNLVAKITVPTTICAIPNDIIEIIFFF